MSPKKGLFQQLKRIFDCHILGHVIDWLTGASQNACIMSEVVIHSAVLTWHRLVAAKMDWSTCSRWSNDTLEQTLRDASLAVASWHSQDPSLRA